MSATTERRVAPRVQPAVETFFHIDPAGKAKAREALVWDISRSGISFLAGTAPTPGEILAGELVHGGTSLAILCRVIHVRLYSTGDFFCGAQFMRELTDAEINRFVA